MVKDIDIALILPHPWDKGRTKRYESGKGRQKTRKMGISHLPNIPFDDILGDGKERQVATVTRNVDDRGRLCLGQSFAGQPVIIKKIARGVLQVIKAEVVPSREAWLFKNPKALKAVLDGIEHVRAGRVSEGPDLAKGARLADEIGE